MNPENRSHAFTVVLANSGREYPVAEDRSILEILLEAGEDVPHSCELGVCGTCETGVVAGRPDHRDLILSEKERASGKTMLICCSRSYDDRLVLDM
jgi:ferredoxin